MHSVYVVDYFIDCVFAVNVVASLYVGYIDDEGTKVMMLSRIRQRCRLSVGFYLEVIAILPLDFIQIGTGWAPAVRVTKLLRIWSLKNYLGRLQVRAVPAHRIFLLLRRPPGPSQLPCAWFIVGVCRLRVHGYAACAPRAPSLASCRAQRCRLHSQ